jgi:hypothetical protein
MTIFTSRYVNMTDKMYDAYKLIIKKYKYLGDIRFKNILLLSHIYFDYPPLPLSAITYYKTDNISSYRLAYRRLAHLEEIGLLIRLPYKGFYISIEGGLLLNEFEKELNKSV